MFKEYGTIVGRVGIILLFTGIVITLVGYLRSSTHTNRIDSNLVTYLGVGLAVVGVILLLIFVIEFVSNKKKTPITDLKRISLCVAPAFAFSLPHGCAKAKRYARAREVILMQSCERKHNREKTYWLI
jgi:uncharacterized membrane protein YGL010W